MTAMRQTKGRINGHKSRKSYIRRGKQWEKKKIQELVLWKSKSGEKNRKMQIIEKHPNITRN